MMTHEIRMLDTDATTARTLPLRLHWGPWGRICSPQGTGVFRCEFQRGAYRDLAVEGDPGQGWYVAQERRTPYLTDVDEQMRQAILAVPGLRMQLFSSPEAAMAAVEEAIAAIAA